MINSRKLFDKLSEEGINWNTWHKVPNRLSIRRDLDAMLYIDNMFPGTTDIIQAAEHDIIYFCITADALDTIATEEDIRRLDACGCFIDSDSDMLAMYK